MTCNRCGANEEKYFIEGVCRRCIHLDFGVVESVFDDFSDDGEYELKFELTPFQKSISQEIVASIEKGDIFLEAVCGAGKTEMCYDLLKKCITEKKTIGWAIPRRQVVLELKDRIQEDFKACKVVAVCGGHTDDLLGDVILCTTHQLYRYHQYFDILIVDEPDAFPFSGDDLLFGLMKKSVKGKILFMSATKDDALIQKLNNTQHLKMPLRPSLEPLPIPILRNNLIHLVFDYILHKDEKQLFFVPTKKMAVSLSKLFKIPYITSSSEDKERIIGSFKSDTKGKLIATTILERGVTFKDVFVYVIEANHPIFDVSSLIQISGRVLRGSSTKGACYFYTTQKCEEVLLCIETLINTNTLAESVLNPK